MLRDGASDGRILEIAHVLFMDVVSFSLLPMDAQTDVIGQLQKIVRDTPEFDRVSTRDGLICLPTGDGMALVFFGDPGIPVRCARQIALSLKTNPQIKLRMGIHTGPVYRVADINANRNVAGGGINFAQRVMDRGKAGHILISKASVDMLLQLDGEWKAALHDVGEVEVKHGASIHIYNLYTSEFGYPGSIESERTTQSFKKSSESTGSPGTNGGRPSRLRLLAIAVVVAIGAGANWLVGPSLDALLRPLPRQRFLALMAWPPDTSPQVLPLLKGVLDAAGNRLARAEAFDRDLLIISSGDTGQPVPKSLAEVGSSLGANLVMGAAMRMEESHYLVVLRIFEAATGKVLRERDLNIPSADLSQLAQRTATAAAEMLGLPREPSKIRDQDEVAMLSRAAFQLFSDAEELRSQPNDIGLDAAIEKYQKLLDVEPHFPLGYANLALAYATKYQKTQDQAYLSLAERNAGLALKYNPNSSKGFLATALVDLRSGKTQQAVDSIGKALALDPGSPQILYYKARIFRDLAQPREEENVYHEIISQRPNFWPAYNELGWILYRQTQYSKAAVAFGQAAAVAPRVALPLANQGTMYLALNQEQAAEEAFRRSVERAPNEFAWSSLGSIAFKRGNYPKALEYYEKAAGLTPKNHRTWRNIADCFEMLGDLKRQQENYAKAAAILSDSLRVNPKPGASWATLAFYHAKLGRSVDARGDLKAAEERGLDQRAQFTKAQTLAVLGRKEEALDLVLDCIDHGLSPVEVELALDLKALLVHPRYRGILAKKGIQTVATAGVGTGSAKEPTK